jgi:hypothetical protein
MRPDGIYVAPAAGFESTGLDRVRTFVGAKCSSLSPMSMTLAQSSVFGTRDEIRAADRTIEHTERQSLGKIRSCRASAKRTSGSARSASTTACNRVSRYRSVFL